MAEMDNQQERIGIIVVDMWNHYPCRPAEARIQQIAKQIDTLLCQAVKKEHVIVAFCPSDIRLEDITTDQEIKKYENSKAFKRSIEYNKDAAPGEISDLDTINLRGRFHRYIINQNGDWLYDYYIKYKTVDECDCKTNDGERNSEVHGWLEKYVYCKMNEKPLFDAFQERSILSNNNYSIVRYLWSQGVKRAYLVGVHANMCFFSRLCGVLYLLKYGITPCIVKDMTDTRFSRFQYPFKDHFDANDQFFSYIEKEIRMDELIERLNEQKLPYEEPNLPVLDKNLKIEVVDSNELTDILELQKLQQMEFVNDRRLSSVYGKPGSEELTLDSDEWGKERPMFPRGIEIYMTDTSITGIRISYLGQPGEKAAKTISIGNTEGTAKQVWKFPIGVYINRVLGTFGQGLLGIQVVLCDGSSFQLGEIDRAKKGFFEFLCDKHYGVTSFLGKYEAGKITAIRFRQTPYNTFKVVRKDNWNSYHVNRINYLAENDEKCTFVFFEGAFYLYCENRFVEIDDKVILHSAESQNYELNAFQLVMDYNLGEIRDETGSKEVLQNVTPPNTVKDSDPRGDKYTGFTKDIKYEKKDWYMFQSWNGSTFYMQWARDPQEGAGKDFDELYVWEDRKRKGHTGAQLLEQLEWPEDEPWNESEEGSISLSSLVGYSLNLSGEFGLNFHMLLDNKATEDASAYMQLTAAGGSIKKVLVKDAEVRQNGKIRETIFFCKAAPKELGQTISAQLFFDDGQESGEAYTFSVQEYANQMGKRPDMYLLTQETLKMLLNYGACAQIYFNYNLENMADSDLDEMERKLPDEKTICEYLEFDEDQFSEIEGIVYEGTSLIMASELTIRHYFELKEGAEITQYTFRLKETGQTIEPVRCDSNYSLDISHLTVNDLYRPYQVKVSYHGDDSHFITYSIASYIKAVLQNEAATRELKNLVKSLFCFYKSCYEYLEIR